MFMHKHGTVVASFGHDGIALSSCGSEVYYGFFVGVLLVEMKLVTGRLPEFVDETLELRSIVDVSPDAGYGFQPIFNFSLDGFQCR